MGAIPRPINATLGRGIDEAAELIESGDYDVCYEMLKHAEANEPIG